MEATMNEAMDVNSPLSKLPPKKIRDLPMACILEQLEKYYGVKPPGRVVESDYSLWQCAETGLQFAWPMLPGNVAFYEWVSQFESYYPGVRWEYGQVRRLVGSESFSDRNSFKVLDVGCGKGDFLHGLDALPSAKRFALDLNATAIRACSEQGFQAFCGTVETAIAAGVFRAGDFPVVTSFHCLEHVSRPVEFVRALIEVTAPGGRVFVSTPYSPMSFESDWFDIMNHPPHHMTRWNLAAYRRLAELLGVKMRYFVPPSSAAKQALNTFRLLQYGPHRRMGKVRQFADLACHFPEFLRQYRKQLARNRSQQVGGADVILVELRKK
jgi:SAM-dependent methyltransferase